MRKAFHLHIRGSGWPQYSFSKLGHLLLAFGATGNRLFLRDLGKFPELDYVALNMHCRTSSRVPRGTFGTSN